MKTIKYPAMYLEPMTGICYQVKARLANGEFIVGRINGPEWVGSAELIFMCLIPVEGLTDFEKCFYRCK